MLHNSKPFKTLQNPSKHFIIIIIIVVIIIVMIIVHWFHKQCNPAEILRFKSLSPCFIMLHMVAEGNTMDEKKLKQKWSDLIWNPSMFRFFHRLAPFQYLMAPQAQKCTWIETYWLQASIGKLSEHLAQQTCLNCAETQRSEMPQTNSNHLKASQCWGQTLFSDLCCQQKENICGNSMK